MTKLFKSAALVGAIALIAGCASSNDNDNDPVIIQNADFVDLEVAATAMAATFVDLDTGASIAVERDD